MLEKRGTLNEPYTLTFGKDGKPFYVSGPHDNPKAIIAKLEKNPGPGNYDYIILADPFADDDFDEDELQDDA